jgi:hypothetical protein
VRGTSTYPAEERARGIAGRIEEVARTASIAPEAVQPVADDDFVKIGAGDRFLVAVTEADAKVESLDRRLLARVYVERIQAAIRAYRQAREPQVLLRAERIRGALRAVVSVLRLATAALLVYFWLHLVPDSFPATRPLAARLLNLVLDALSRLANGLLAQLPDLAFLLVLYLVTRWLLGLTRLFFEALAKGHVALSGFEPEWRR